MSRSGCRRPGLDRCGTGPSEWTASLRGQTTPTKVPARLGRMARIGCSELPCRSPDASTTEEAQPPEPRPGTGVGRARRWGVDRPRNGGTGTTVPPRSQLRAGVEGSGGSPSRGQWSPGLPRRAGGPRPPGRLPGCRGLSPLLRQPCGRWPTPPSVRPPVHPPSAGCSRPFRPRSAAQPASWWAAAMAIPWVMVRARMSSTPRKIPGNPSELLTCLGKSLRPVATTRAPGACASGDSTFHHVGVGGGEEGQAWLAGRGAIAKVANHMHVISRRRTGIGSNLTDQLKRLRRIVRGTD